MFLRLRSGAAHAMGSLGPALSAPRRGRPHGAYQLPRPIARLHLVFPPHSPLRKSGAGHESDSECPIFRLADSVQRLVAQSLPVWSHGVVMALADLRRSTAHAARTA